MDEKQLENLTQEQLLTLFVERLIADKGLEATEELKTELLIGIDKKVNAEIVKALPDEYLRKLNAEFDAGTGTADKIAEIVEESGIDMGKITEKALTAFRNEYLGKEEA